MSFLDSIRNLFNHTPDNARIFDVEGMHCGHCEAHIKETLTKLDGVHSAKANHKTGKVVVVADDKVTDEAIKAAIKEAGFEVGNSRQ